MHYFLVAGLEPYFAHVVIGNGKLVKMLCFSHFCWLVVSVNFSMYTGGRSLDACDYHDYLHITHVID